MEEDLDLYADYKCNEYYVSYVDNVYGKVMDTFTVTYDSEYSLPKLTGVDGFTHADWKTEDGASYGFSGKWRTASDVILYAEWKNAEYKVTLNPDKGSVSELTVSVTYDKPYSLPTPERLNYTFLGWYDEDGKYVSQNATWKRTKDETFIAKWTNIQNTYVFDPGDGTCDVTSMVIGWEDEYVLPVPVKENMTFFCWRLDEQMIPLTGIWKYSNSGGTLVASYVASSNSASVEIGYYPQSKVTDSSRLALLSTYEQDLSTMNSWSSYNYYNNCYSFPSYMWYKDVVIGDNRYRGVYFNCIRPSECYCDESGNLSIQTDNGYKKGQVYWFAWEPVEWRLLSNKTGEYLLLSNVILDSQEFYYKILICTWGLPNPLIQGFFDIRSLYLTTFLVERAI